jgi:hypothetical protein
MGEAVNSRRLRADSAEKYACISEPLLICLHKSLHVDGHMCALCASVV